MAKPTPSAGEDDSSSANEMSLPNSSLVTSKLQEIITSDSGSSLADISFITSDGVRIPAVRILLSMSSPYFQKLFSSEFVENKLPEVPISISSSILREILEFIHTDDCSRLRAIRESIKQSLTISCKDVQGLVELADAADYTHVERLISRCEEGVKCVMSKAPHTACAVVRALAQGRSSWGKFLLQEAVDTAVWELEESLLVKYDRCGLSCGLMHLDARAAEDVFSSVKTGDTEQYKLFQALVVWASDATALQLEWKRRPWSHAEIFLDTEKIKIADDLLEPAKRIAKWFDVSRFSPGFLANVVEESGLVDHHVLCAAYKRQSTLLEEDVKQKDTTICTASEELQNTRSDFAYKLEELKNVTIELSSTSEELEFTKIELLKRSRELQEVKRELATTLEGFRSIAQTEVPAARNGCPYHGYGCR